MKYVKEVNDPKDPIINKNYDKDIQTLDYINSKIQYMIIKDIAPILEVWRNLKAFAPVANTNLNEY